MFILHSEQFGPEGQVSWGKTPFPRVAKKITDLMSSDAALKPTPLRKITRFQYTFENDRIGRLQPGRIVFPEKAGHEGRNGHGLIAPSSLELKLIYRDSERSADSDASQLPPLALAINGLGMKAQSSCRLLNCKIELHMYVFILFYIFIYLKSTHKISNLFNKNIGLSGFQHKGREFVCVPN
jgi:hypothetical protein